MWYPVYPIINKQEMNPARSPGKRKIYIEGGSGHPLQSLGAGVRATLIEVSDEPVIKACQTRMKIELSENVPR